MDLRSIDLAALNSATKYPSIPTYHHINPSNGILLDQTLPLAGQVTVTEKVDGVSARIVVLPGGQYVIGSREELLHAKGDVVANPALGVVRALRDLADSIIEPPGRDTIMVYFGEVYGGPANAAWRNYCGNHEAGFRLFDIAHISSEVLHWPRSRISGWRQRGGQAYLPEALLASQTVAEVTPRLATLDGADLPTGLQETRDWMAGLLPATRAALDDQARGHPEGVVLRTENRRGIVKLRFEDYDRTLHRQKAGAR